MATWVLVVVLVNGSFGAPTATIPGFTSEEACQQARTHALKERHTDRDTRVRDAFCFMGPSQ